MGPRLGRSQIKDYEWLVEVKGQHAVGTFKCNFYFQDIKKYIYMFLGPRGYTCHYLLTLFTVKYDFLKLVSKDYRTTFKNVYI